MKKPVKELDVHMGVDGQNFTCQTCHATNNHNIKGNAMVVSPGGKNHIACTDCHDREPHRETLLNKPYGYGCLPDLSYSRVCQGNTDQARMGLVNSRRGKG